MEGACTKQGIPCPFSECGCDHRCARKEMNKHIRDEPVKHLTLVGQTILAHKKTLEMHSEIMDSQEEKLGKTISTVYQKIYNSGFVMGSNHKICFNPTLFVLFCYTFI